MCFAPPTGSQPTVTAIVGELLGDRTLLNTINTSSCGFVNVPTPDLSCSFAGKRLTISSVNVLVNMKVNVPELRGTSAEYLFKRQRLRVMRDPNGAISGTFTADLTPRRPAPSYDPAPT